MFQRGVTNARSRLPLVPKELIVPTCQRLAFVLFVMCATALCIRLANYLEKGNIAHMRLGTAPVNGTHFFLDIGNTGSSIAHTEHLEENGWQGVCASAFPEASRSCKAISMPVVADAGEQVMVADCSSPMQVLLSTFRDCPKTERAGVGIVDLLKVSKAPAIIDYVALDTQGTELAILKRFPFDNFCVRAWTVANVGSKADIQALFQAQNCHTKLAGGLTWARCKCMDFADSLQQVQAGPGGHQNTSRPVPLLANFAKRRKEKRKFSHAAIVGGSAFVHPERHVHHEGTGPKGPLPKVQSERPVHHAAASPEVPLVRRSHGAKP